MNIGWLTNTCEDVALLNSNRIDLFKYVVASQKYNKQLLTSVAEAIVQLPRADKSVMKLLFSYQYIQICVFGSEGIIF